MSSSLKNSTGYVAWTESNCSGVELNKKEVTSVNREISGYERNIQVSDEEKMECKVSGTKLLSVIHKSQQLI